MLPYTKIVAFYLPQFHEIEENNKWWGKGFTEWTNVKKAHPLYKGHYQPKVPLEMNYYDLSDINMLRVQAERANEFGVDGFCFYHYWFQGKKLLEKPIETLLTHPEIKIEYCLSWANETWSRRWNGEEKDILIKQSYGREDDWENHIQYLIPFFKDNRYIKVDNKPVLLLYRTFEIPYFEEMISYWNEKLISEGFAGIYIIETLNSKQKKKLAKGSAACVEFEPMYTLYQHVGLHINAYRYLFKQLKLSRFGFRDFISYDFIWKKIIVRKHKKDEKIFYGGFPAWDNTARKGKNALVFRGNTVKKFEKYFSLQYKKSLDEKNEFIFLNAWNEWGEGAYLEADEVNKYDYLNVIKYVKDCTINNEDKNE